MREQLSQADGWAGREDKAQPAGRDGGGWVRGTPVPAGVRGAGGRYLGAVEVTAMRVREPARPAGALVDGDIPQLHVHPHDPPVPKDGVSPGGHRCAHPVPPTQSGRAPALSLAQPRWGCPRLSPQLSAMSPHPRAVPRSRVWGGWRWVGGEAAAPGCELCPSSGILTPPMGKWGQLRWPPRAPRSSLGSPKGTRVSPWGRGRVPALGLIPSLPTASLCGSSVPPVPGTPPAPGRGPRPL